MMMSYLTGASRAPSNSVQSKYLGTRFWRANMTIPVKVLSPDRLTINFFNGIGKKKLTLFT
jgi:hypothetical protein